jgi:RNA polymerase sigma-70 factor (ECF subfamily)
MEMAETHKNAASSWKSFDQRFRRPLLAYFYRRISDRTVAEDLTQEVFARLVRRPDQNNGTTIEAYVFKVASSVLSDWGRRQVSHQSGGHRPLSDSIDSTHMPANLVEERTPERVLLAKSVLKDIERALEELSERTRDIFLLSRMEQVAHRDIAIRYGISVSAVEKHVLKAIARITAKAHGHE